MNAIAKTDDILLALPNLLYTVQHHITTSQLRHNTQVGGKPMPHLKYS